MADLQGKTVLITGASRGIGAEAARHFAAAGARVALVARSEEKVAGIAGELGPDRALAIPCDVSRFWEVRAAVDAAAQTFGSLDVVVANAGVIDPISPLSQVDPDAWSQAIDINVKGVFNVMRAAMPTMMAQGSGSILTLSSGAAHRPVEAWSQYCASKAAMAMMVRSADLEAREAGLRVIGLSPGTVATDMQRQIKDSGINPISQLDWSEHIQPDWPARALLWMCGAEADDFLGGEVSLRDEDTRRRIGLA